MTRPLRSLLFIPGDSDKKLAKVAGCGADAVILDLEDSIGFSNKI
ncbi:MAG: aldolase/citrate lyase family protein, partial [Tsuneonella sp.]